MKRIQQVKTFLSFLTMESVSDINILRAKFIAIQANGEQAISSWPPGATRQKIKLHYWISQAVPHFGVVVGGSLAVGLLLMGDWSMVYLAVLLAVLLVAVVATSIPYWLTYCAEFLPNLEIVMAEFHTKQQEQQAEAQAHQIEVQRTELLQQQAEHFHLLREKFAELSIGISLLQASIPTQPLLQDIPQPKIKRRLLANEKKCRNVQFSIFALILIHHVMTQATQCALSSKQQTALWLERLHGVNHGSLRAKLEFLYGSSNRWKGQDTRQRAEHRKGFEQAMAFFQAFNYDTGVRLLQELEIKVMGSK